MCAEDPADIEQYRQEKYDWLKTFLALPNGIPSHDTIGRVLARLDPKQFQACFLHWIRDICQLSSGEVLPIDGKTLRHSYDTELGQSAIHMVSAWAATNRLVLGQVKVSTKSNEITAIPELLDLLDIADCIVTIDALGCQKDIAAQIIENDADYVLALKGNQEHLYDDVKRLFETLLQQEVTPPALEYYETTESAHGRVEIRRHWTTSALDPLRILPDVYLPACCARRTSSLGAQRSRLRRAYPQGSADFPSARLSPFLYPSQVLPTSPTYGVMHP